MDCVCQRDSRDIIHRGDKIKPAFSPILIACLYSYLKIYWSHYDLIMNNKKYNNLQLSEIYKSNKPEFMPFTQNDERIT